MNRIFVDADAFIALIREDDSNHQAAVRYIESLKKPTTFVTSNYVFSEVITVLSLRAGKQVAIGFIDTIQSPSSSYTILSATEEIDQAALIIFKAQVSKNISFVDCANMAMIKSHKLDGIFSFDKVYKKNGILTVPKGK